jgi:hypothetical protein
VYGKGFFGHGPFGVDVLMIYTTRGHVIEQLDSPDFDNPVPVERVKAGCLCVHHDLTHPVVS